MLCFRIVFSDCVLIQRVSTVFSHVVASSCVFFVVCVNAVLKCCVLGLCVRLVC